MSLPMVGTPTTPVVDILLDSIRCPCSTPEMNATQTKKELLLRYPKPYSTHSSVYEDDWWVSVGVFFGRYSIAVQHRWSRRRVLDTIVWYWEPGYSFLVDDWRGCVAKFIRRLEESEKGQVGRNAAEDPTFAKDYPGLCEHLTCDWLDGKARQTSTLGVSVDQGRWKARLADRENGLVLFVSADSFFGSLDALEGSIVAGDGDWRQDQYSQQGKGRKR